MDTQLCTDWHSLLCIQFVVDIQYLQCVNVCELQLFLPFVQKPGLFVGFSSLFRNPRSMCILQHYPRTSVRVWLYSNTGQYGPGSRVSKTQSQNKRRRTAVLFIWISFIRNCEHQKNKRYRTNWVPSAVFNQVTRIRIYRFLHHTLQAISHFATGVDPFSLPARFLGDRHFSWRGPWAPW